MKIFIIIIRNLDLYVDFICKSALIFFCLYTSVHSDVLITNIAKIVKTKIFSMNSGLKLYKRIN